MISRVAKRLLLACAAVGLSAAIAIIAPASWERYAVSQRTTGANCSSFPESFYGVGLGADRLANLEVGRRGQQVSYRFRAAYSAPITSVRVFFKTGTGYSAGDGGTMTVALQTDDAHAPSGHVLSSVTVDRVAMGPFNRLLTLQPSVPLTAGALYYLVFTNVDLDPERNFVSLDDLESLDAPGPMAAYSASALTRDAGEKEWSEHVRHIPIFALQYSNGCQQGQGYIDALSRSGVFQITGEKKVREIVRVSQSDRFVSSVSVRVRRSPDYVADLIIRLVDAGGNELIKGAIQASDAPTDYSWVTYSFPAEKMLLSGRTYYLELSSGGRFETFPLQSGITYGFDVPGLFRDGEYQTNDGRGWRSEFRNLQLQFYFTSRTRSPF